MNRLKYYLAAFFLLIVMNQPVTADDSTCSYTKSVQQGRTTFDVKSRPVVGCDVQIVTVAVRRGDKKAVGVKSDVDYLAQSAKAVDLTGDGTPELVITSRTSKGVVTEALDVYWLDGTTLRRAVVPELDDKSGYKGGDSFGLKGRLIVRTIPIYRDGDPVGKPTVGTRSLKYEFREGALTPYVPAAAPLAVTGITASEAGIEIRGGGPINKFKVMKLENPERIAIDIPGADSSLAGKKIAINRFGITTARIGRNNGFLRVVLDTNLSSFPKYQVKSSGTGTLVELKQ